MPVRDLDSSSLAACVALDQRCLNGLWTLDQWRRELEDPHRLCLGWFDNDGQTLHGLACGWLVIDELQITVVAVDPSVRRRGYGRDLLAALLQKARQAGAVHATLEVASTNCAAIALYAESGFVNAGTRPRYYSDGRDALIQCCRIGSEVHKSCGQ